MGTHFLDCLFSPNAIAVFGASERPDAVGNRVFFNLCNDGFNGQVYAINPKHQCLVSLMIAVERWENHFQRLRANITSEYWGRIVLGSFAPQLV